VTRPGWPTTAMGVRAVGAAYDHPATADVDVGVPALVRGTHRFGRRRGLPRRSGALRWSPSWIRCRALPADAPSRARSFRSDCRTVDFFTEGQVLLSRSLRGQAQSRLARGMLPRDTTSDDQRDPRPRERRPIMNPSSPSLLRQTGTCLQVLLLVGIASAGCKEDLDEARSALATAQRDRDDLKVRLAGVEHELATARAELARQKAAAPDATGLPCSATARATTDVTSSPAVAGKTAVPDRSRVETGPKSSLTPKGRERPKS